MAWEDKAVEAFTSHFPRDTKYGAALVGAAFVVILGAISHRSRVEARSDTESASKEA